MAAGSGLLAELCGVGTMSCGRSARGGITSGPAAAEGAAEGADEGKGLAGSVPVWVPVAEGAVGVAAAHPLTSNRLSKI